MSAETPDDPEVHVRTDRETPEESVSRVMAYLREAGYVAASPGKTREAGS